MHTEVTDAIVQVSKYRKDNVTSSKKDLNYNHF